MTKRIFKLQRPIESTEPVPFMLAYNEDRTTTIYLPMMTEAPRVFGHEHKIFRYCTIVDGTLHVGDVAPEGGCA